MLLSAYDALMRLPLTLLAGYFLVKEWQALQLADGLLRVAAHITTMLFLALIALMTLLRHRPIRRADGWLPRLAALAGFLLLYALLLLPRAPVNPALDIAALLLLLVGHFLCAVALMQLGRSFSVMPEARKLVTRGLYSRIRHPLYLAEAVGALGIFLLYRSLAAAIFVLVQLVIQVWRMHEEEKVLRAAFPEYEPYSRRTARVIPGVY